MQSTLRSFDLAHLGHIELLTPDPAASLHFFLNVMGMTESGRSGDSVYLRGWDDYERHTLKLTPSAVAGMGHLAFRATSPALDRRVAVIEASGLGEGMDRWDLGHGPAYAFTTTDGHNGDLLRDRVVRPGRSRRHSRTRRSGFRRMAPTSGASTTSTCSRPTSPSSVSSWRTSSACGRPR
jgi:catechol 2,3-dioxygenase-like lactoylglutathione lyase family enzyme